MTEFSPAMGVRRYGGNSFDPSAAWIVKSASGVAAPRNESSIVCPTEKVLSPLRVTFRVVSMSRSSLGQEQVLCLSHAGGVGAEPEEQAAEDGTEEEHVEGGAVGDPNPDSALHQGALLLECRGLSDGHEGTFRCPVSRLCFSLMSFLRTLVVTGN